MFDSHKSYCFVIDKCPCEGCCDFNCCDELDFFMHRAYHDYYSKEYGAFEDYYEQWYQDFYHWWKSPTHDYETDEEDNQTY